MGSSPFSYNPGDLTLCKEPLATNNQSPHLQAIRGN